MDVEHKTLILEIHTKLFCIQRDVANVKTELAVIKRELEHDALEREGIKDTLSAHARCIYGADGGGLVAQVGEMRRDIAPWLKRAHRLTDWLLGAMLLGAALFFGFIKSL